MQFMEPTTGRQLQYVSEKEMGRKRQAEEFVWKLLHSPVQRFGCWRRALFLKQRVWSQQTEARKQLLLLGMRNDIGLGCEGAC